MPELTIGESRRNLALVTQFVRWIDVHIYPVYNSFMNWKKIGTGTLLAVIVISLFNHTVLWWNYMRPAAIGPSHFDSFKFELLYTLLTAFLLAWLYAVARPRLGPGAKTAIAMGSAGFLLSSGAQWVIPRFLHDATAGDVIPLVLQWIKYVAATCAAGWQYMEKP
jgi:hypothetical protein